MAVLHSWPLASDPAAPGTARQSRRRAQYLDRGVGRAHPAARSAEPVRSADPLSRAHSLAFSEHMFVPSVMGAPLLWAGASPVLVYNLLIIAGLALSGWSMYLLMRRWTGSESAGIIAGLVYAFNAHVLTRFVHLQAHHVEFFPLLLYALRSRPHRTAVSRCRCCSHSRSCCRPCAVTICWYSRPTHCSRRQSFAGGSCLQGRLLLAGVIAGIRSRTVPVAVLRGQPRSGPGAPRQRRRAIQRGMARLPRHRRPPALRVVEPTVLRRPNGALPRLDGARPRGPGA